MYLPWGPKLGNLVDGVLSFDTTRVTSPWFYAAIKSTS
ncbi:unnamed protein product, partial [Allacma fusca]